ncbi:MAG: transposase [bacterium]
MSYQVEQKIGKHIYIYEAEGYWDPVKKQTRQKRTYIGKKDPVTGEIVTPRKSLSPKASRDFGAIYLLYTLAKTHGLIAHLERAFPEEGQDVFNMAAFQLCEGKPFYLMKPWLEATHIDSFTIADSQAISRFFQDLGQRESDRRHFIDRWAYGQPASRAVAFDITSLSSHGKLIDLLEWGYNRDGENLPQINLGIVMRIPDGIPMSYHIYPGSIADVSTLSNIIKELDSCGVSIRRFVLDRGFFSTSNIMELSQEKIPFIIPMPFRSTLAHQLLLDTQKALQSPQHAFIHHGQALFHTSKEIQIGGYKCIAHVYFDEERKARETSHLIHRLTEFEAFMSQRSFETLDDVMAVINDKGRGLGSLYTIRLEGAQAILTRKTRTLTRMINRHGKVILVSKASRLSRDELIYLYRRRDMIEKLFDVMKNEFDSNRIRIHSRDALEGRLFIMFISMILYFILQHRMQQSEFLHNFSVADIMAKLKILRSVTLSNGKTYLTEMTKKQRDILTAFNIPLPKKPCY